MSSPKLVHVIDMETQLRDSFEDVVTVQLFNVGRFHLTRMSGGDVT